MPGEGKKDHMSAESAAFEGPCRSTPCFYFIGQNLITWSLLAAEEAGKCSLTGVSKIQAVINIKEQMGTGKVNSSPARLLSLLL